MWFALAGFKVHTFVKTFMMMFSINEHNMHRSNRKNSTGSQIIEFLFNHRDEKFSQAEVMRRKGIDKAKSTVSEWFRAFMDIGIVKPVEGNYAWYTYEPIVDLSKRVISKFRSKYLRNPLPDEIVWGVKRECYARGKKREEFSNREELKNWIETAKKETGWSEPSDDEVREANRKLENRLCVGALLNYLEVSPHEETIFEEIGEKREKWYERGARKIQVIGCDMTIIERAIVKGEIWESHMKGGKKYRNNHPKMVPEVEERRGDASIKVHFRWKEDVKHHLKKGRGAGEEETTISIANPEPVWKEKCTLYLFKLADEKPIRASSKEVDVDGISELTEPKKWLPPLRKKRRGDEFYRLINDYVPVWEIAEVEEFIEKLVKDPESIRSEFGESSEYYFKSVHRCIRTSFDLKSGSGMREEIYRQSLDCVRGGIEEDCKPIRILETFFKRDPEKREEIFEICLEKIEKLPLESNSYSNYESIFIESYRIGWKAKEELEGIIEGMLKKEKIEGEKSEHLFRVLR